VKTYFHVLVTISILVISAGASYVLPQIVDLVSCIGGVLVTLIILTIPGLCYYKLNGPYKNLVYVMTIVLTGIGFFASFLSILDTLGIIDLINM